MESEKKGMAIWDICVSTCPDEKADPINNKCQLCDIAFFRPAEKGELISMQKTGSRENREREEGTVGEWGSQLVINLPQLLGSGRRGECQNCSRV